METKFTHFDEQGNAVMVDVSEKNPTSRTALAEGKIQVNREVMDAILHHTVKKGGCAGCSACSRNYGSETDFFVDSDVPCTSNQ